MTRRRRRIANVVVVVLAIVPAVIVLVGLLTGDRERIVSYWERAIVDADGRAQIREVIDYDFGSGNERHGIYRVVPGLSESSGIRVSSPTAPSQIELSPGKVRIGDPDVTVDGTHRYEIGYSLDTLVRGNELAWNVVGTEWTVGIESVTAQVGSERVLTDATCDQGDFGETGGCEVVQVHPGLLLIETGPLAAGEAVTVRATLGETIIGTTPGGVLGVPPFPGQTGSALALPTLAAFVVAAGAALVTGRVLRRAGREEAPIGWVGPAAGIGSGIGSLTVPGRVDTADLTDDLAPQLAPPRRITPAQGGVLVAEKVTADHKSAWLLDQAEAGAIALEGDPTAPTMRWLGGGGAAQNAPLLTMFDSRPTVDLGTYDSHFSSGWQLVGGELDAWRTSSGLWSAMGERRRRWAIGIGIALVLIGAFDAGLLAYRWALSDPSVLQLGLLALPMGVGVGLLARAWELRVRTAEGSALFVEVEAFRRHLAAAGADDVDRASDDGLLHEHLAWAVALGVSDTWVKAVGGSRVARSGSYDPSYYVIAAGLHSSTSSAATAPSSSGGGGGGGAGGGGGGGGGGSW